MIVLLLISVGLWWVATHKAHMSESVSLRPFHAHIDLGPAYILFIYLVFAGTTNAVNLTDGLDGLAAGCAAIALLAYIGITFVTDRATTTWSWSPAACAAPASASSGSTASRRACSWATPARSRSAARSRRWR